MVRAFFHKHRKLGRALAVLGGLAALALAAAHLYLSRDALREEVQQRASQALGLRVSVQGLGLSLWPLPGVALQGLHIATQPPLRAELVTARPDYLQLLTGRVELATLTVQDAQLSTQGIGAASAAISRMLEKQELAAQKRSGPQTDADPEAPRLQRLLLRNVQLHLSGGAARFGGAVDGELELDASQQWPLQLEVKTGVLSGSVLRGVLQPQALNLSQIDVRAGGGTVRGQLTLHWRGPTVLNGALQTQNVSLSALLGAQSKLQGRLQAQTSLSARTHSLGALGAALQTQTRFTVSNALIQGVDLQKAVLTVGINRGGQTRLDVLSGNLNTSGALMSLTNLQASAGALSATGAVNVSANKTLSGRISVDAAGPAGALVGVPLAVSGTTDAPQVMLTRGAMLGAAIGTVIAPGVGTGAGVKIGDSISEGLGKLFGK